MTRFILLLFLMSLNTAQAETSYTIYPVSSGGVTNSPVGYIDSNGSIGSVSSGGVKSPPTAKIGSDGVVRSVSAGGISSSSGSNWATSSIKSKTH